MAQIIPILFPDYSDGTIGGSTLPLGHAGVMVASDAGVATYYEFGRYNPGTVAGVVTSNPVYSGNLDCQR